jgi:hypothetical protein
MEAKVALEGLLQGSIRSVEFAGGLITVNAPRRDRVYLPGSFNPLHDGHKCVNRTPLLFRMCHFLDELIEQSHLLFPYRPHFCICLGKPA